MGCGCRGLCRGDVTTFENPQFRSLFYIRRAVPQNQKKNKARGGLLVLRSKREIRWLLVVVEVAGVDKLSLL